MNLGSLGTGQVDGSPAKKGPMKQICCKQPQHHEPIGASEGIFQSTMNEPNKPAHSWVSCTCERKSS